MKCPRDVRPLAVVVCHVYEDAWDGDHDVHWTYRTCLGNPGLVSLDGLEGLTSLSALRLVNNSLLEDVSTQGCLETLSSLQIANNAVLSDLSVIGAPLTSTSSIMIGCVSGYSTIDHDYGGSPSRYNCYGASATTSLPPVSGKSLRCLLCTTSR